MSMPRSKYTKRRRITQGITLLLLLSIPLRFFCLDIQKECLRVFGWDCGFQLMFYPLFVILCLLFAVLCLCIKNGRVFCSHICPMHMFLEAVNNPRNKHSDIRILKVWAWGLVFALFLTEVILSFFQPLTTQVAHMAAGSLRLIGVAAALVTGFLILFVHYKERFCKRGCPYALMQMLLQTGGSRYMDFSNPQKTCTNCHACDSICPFNLRPRLESRGDDCTNCNLCAEACTNELGQGNTLFHLINPGDGDGGS